MTDSDSVKLTIRIKAPAAAIWAALTTPDIIKTYFFGAMVQTDWKPGSSITWTGEYKGKAYQDKGTIKEFAPNKRLSMTHWSPMSGLDDAPGNYHTVTYELEPDGDDGTELTLTQRNLTGSTPEQAKKNWESVLDGIKRAVAH